MHFISWIYHADKKIVLPTSIFFIHVIKARVCAWKIISSNALVILLSFVES